MDNQKLKRYLQIRALQERLPKLSGKIDVFLNVIEEDAAGISGKI